MYEGSAVTLKMEKVILINTTLEELVHQCRILHYDIEEDFVELLLTKGELVEVPLDAKYQCEIATKTEVLACTGVVKERFCSEEGKIILFKIENGFYKK